MDSTSIRLEGEPVDLVAQLDLARGDTYEFTNTEPGTIVALAERDEAPERNDPGHTILLYGQSKQIEIDSTRNLYAWSRVRYQPTTLSVFSVA